MKQGIIRGVQGILASKQGFSSGMHRGVQVTNTAKNISRWSRLCTSVDMLDRVSGLITLT
jgi:hypothetical protein